jgi:iron complex outermembrane receptor protein
MPVTPTALPCRRTLLAAACTLAVAGPGLAQEAEAPKVEQVVVTAQKRLERLQDVPVSVKAFTAKQIEAAGIGSTQDFINLTPNMSFDQSFTYGNSFVVLRGVTQINNADSPVAVVVDGVPQGNQKQLRMNLFDVERIEVLKGPQGALYGRNAIGGAINIETRQPGNALEGFAGLSYGTGNTLELSAGLGGALVPDRVLFRVAGMTKRSDGLLTNTYLGREVDAVDRDDNLRAKLLIRASDKVQVDLRASGTDVVAGATYDSIVVDGDPGTMYAPRTNLLGRTRGRTGDFSAKVDIELAAGTLTSITGYTDLKEGYRGDVDFSNPDDLPGGFFGFGFQAGQGQDLGVRMLSQELRFTSPDGRPVRWIAGLYHLDTRRTLDTRAFIDVDGTLEQYDDLSKVIVNNSESNHNLASAVFGQVDMDFGKDWTLSAALRHDRDRRQQTDRNTGDERSATYSKTQPKFTLTHRFDRDTVAYGTMSTGFRSGGFNAPGIPDFRPETLSNFELGYKTVTLGGRLMLNTALFAARSKDFQYFLVDGARLAQIISNIDRVDLRGVDIDWRWLPVRGFEVDGGLGITDSTIKRNTAEPDSVGKHTPKNVPFKLNLGLQYGMPLGGGIEGLVRVDWEHRARKYWHPDNQAVSPALDLFGLRVGVRDAKDRWSLTLVGRNLTNEQYYADINASKYSGLPYDIGWRANGRTVALEARYKL